MHKSSSGGLICLQKKMVAQGQGALAMRRNESAKQGFGSCFQGPQKEQDLDPGVYGFSHRKGSQGSRAVGGLISPVCTQAKESIEGKAHYYHTSMALSLIALSFS